MITTISAKNLDSTVRYINPVKKIDNGNFTVKMSQVEVKEQVKKKSRLKKAMHIGYMTSTSILSATPALAAETLTNTDLAQIFIYLEGIIAFAGLGTAAVLLQSAGVYRMFPKKKEKATDWSVDILKGLTQLVVSPVLVGVIAFVAYLLFGNSDWFIKPY